MIRVFVLYEAEPGRGALRAARRALPQGARERRSGTGAVFGAPMGEPKYKYYAEWEFADMDAFKAAARTDEFMATGKDAMEMGIPFHVHFAESLTEPVYPRPARPDELGFEKIVYEKAPPARDDHASTGRRS